MKVLRWIERGVVVALLVMMMIAVVASTVELGVILYQQMAEPPYLLLDVRKMTEVFGFFLMILLGLELMESIKAYLEESSFHVEVVLLVAIVAMSRKVILMGAEDLTMAKGMSTAAMVLSLAASYYLVKFTRLRAATAPSPAA